MTEKRPIDIKRESSGTAEIGTEDDGAILDMYTLGERIIIIKEKALYELILADTIDPERTNIGLPNYIQRLLINQGRDSETVSRTFLTAKALFKAQFFVSLDTKKALDLSLDLLIELSVLEQEVTNYLSKEKAVSEEYEKCRNKPISFAIPSINDVESRCKTIFQKADHFEQILMDIIRIFYPNDGLTKHSHFPDFYKVLNTKYGEEDYFTLFISRALYFMVTVRTLRNSLDPRLHFVKIKNFELKSDSNIVSPTIELKHKDCKLERVSLSFFLPIVLQNILILFETTLAYLGSKNAKSDFMNYVVKEVPKNIRIYKYVKYSFWSSLGEGGYYHQ